MRVHSVTGAPYLILHNPSKRAYLNMVQSEAYGVKGVATEKDLWIWASWFAHHSQGAEEIGISMTDFLHPSGRVACIHCFQDTIEYYANSKKMLREHIILKKIFGPKMNQIFA